MKKYISIILALCCCNTSIDNDIEVIEETSISTTTTSTTIITNKSDEKNTKYPVSSEITCTSFESDEDLYSWWDKYYPIYGDIAELDLNNDGIPCNGSTNIDLYSTKRQEDPLVTALLNTPGAIKESMEWCLSDSNLDRQNRPDDGTKESDEWIDAKITRQVGEKAFYLVGDRWPEDLYNVLTNNREAFASREFGYQLYLYWAFEGNEDIYNLLVPSRWTIQEAEYYGTSLYVEACMLAYWAKGNWTDRHEGWYKRP